MNIIRNIFPIVGWLSSYKKAQLNGDLSAGLTVGIMLIPQGMAYALIAGMPPVYGLYASIVPQIIYAIFGTSGQLSVAPVAMDSLLVATGISVLATEGTDAYIGFALLLAFFTGAFQLLFGVIRMGFITNLLSTPVISGFTSAAALIIGFNQLNYFLGIDLVQSVRVYEIIWNVFSKITEIHIITLLMGLSGILIIKGVAIVNHRMPGTLLAVAFGVTVVYTLKLHNEGVSIVETIPAGLPSPTMPDFTLGKMGELIPLALTLSVVAFMEAFSVAKAIEAQKGNCTVRPNQELIALGAANLIGSLFRSFPVTGGFSRSAVNCEVGANTPLSSIISATLVALTLLFLTPLFYYLPKAILASVIMVAVANLIDTGYARQLWKDSKVEFILLMATFLVTLRFSMISGIFTGIVLSVLVLLYKSAYPHIARLGRVKEHFEFRNIARFDDLETWENLLILRVDASLTFINIQHFKGYVETAINTSPSVHCVILDAGPVGHIDATASRGLRTLVSTLRSKNVQFLFSEVVGPVRDIMHRTGLIEMITKEHIFLHLDDAVKFATKNIPGSCKKYALQSNVDPVDRK